MAGRKVNHTVTGIRHMPQKSMFSSNGKNSLHNFDSPVKEQHTSFQRKLSKNNFGHQESNMSLGASPIKGIVDLTV